MRTSLLRFICLSIVLTLCVPMVACDMQLGGLIGELITNDAIPEESISMELITGNYHDTLLPDEPITEPDTVVETDVNIGEVDTEIDITEQDTTREDTVVDSIDEITTEPPVVIDPVLVCSQVDQLLTVKSDGSKKDECFSPGYVISWDKIADIKDYTDTQLILWGWLGFFSATPASLGYQIDDEEPVFSADFTFEAEQPVIDAAASKGAKSACRMHIIIPIRELSGTHTIKAIVKDEAGTIEVITEFTLNKAVDPHAPVSLINANEIYSALSTGTHNIFDATVQKDGFGNDYVRWTTNHDGADPYVNIQFYQDNLYVSENAQFLAIKCRVDAENMDQLSGTVFVGSGMGPTGGRDQVGFDYAQHSDWQLVIIDLALLEAIDSSFRISYLRLDCYDQAPDESAYFDIAYFATFKTLEDFIQYDRDHPMSKE